MNFISNAIFTLSGCIEFVSLIICAGFLGVLSTNQVNKGRIIPTFATYIGISVLVIFSKGISNQFTYILPMILYYLRFFLAIYILYKHLSCKVIFFTFLWDLSISLVGSCASCVLTNLIGENSNYVSQFAKMLVQLMVLFLILILRKKVDTQKNIVTLSMIPRNIFVMLILAILGLSALSSLISFSTDNIKMKENILIAIVVILTVILVCIVASLFLNVIGKQHFTAVSQMMEKQVELQINHYKELEKIDAEINRFRHDYSNHLQSILSLIQMNECSLAEEYILKLKEVKYKSDIHIFYTGNRLADAILSDKSSTLGESCKIEYSGIIPLSIENVDLCIVLSNLLDNAIEACRELPSPGVISMYATSQQGYFVLSIKNPTICSDNYYDIPPTSKADKEQHGMGLYNIENIVKKYDGQMKIKCENGLFEVMITMKI